jgi:mono/diheme cytochrome c family protein
MRERLALWVAAAVAGAVASGFAQEANEWTAPDTARAVANPLPLTDEALARGRQVFQKNCLVCHGEAAKGDGPAVKFVQPPPADLTVEEKHKKWTDGELFWKMTNGKKPMPAFGRKLGPNDRWAVVHYLRSLRGK